MDLHRSYRIIHFVKLALNISEPSTDAHLIQPGSKAEKFARARPNGLFYSGTQYTAPFSELPCLRSPSVLLRRHRDVARALRLHHLHLRVVPAGCSFQNETNRKKMTIPAAPVGFLAPARAIKPNAPIVSNSNGHAEPASQTNTTAGLSLNRTIFVPQAQGTGA